MDNAGQGDLKSAYLDNKELSNSISSENSSKISSNLNTISESPTLKNQPNITLDQEDSVLTHMASGIPECIDVSEGSKIPANQQRDCSETSQNSDGENMSANQKAETMETNEARSSPVERNSEGF